MADTYAGLRSPLAGLRTIGLLTALMLSGCGHHRGEASEAGSSGAIITSIAKTTETISGQPLKLPQGPAEMVAISVDLPAGAALAIHKHAWSRFFYVERGTLRVVNHDTGTSRDFKAGEVDAEAVGEWHEGRAVGKTPVRVIVIDLVPPGATNTVVKPE